MSRTPEDAAWAALVALGDPYSRKSSTLVEHFAAYAEEVRAEAKAEALAEMARENQAATRTAAHIEALRADSDRRSAEEKRKRGRGK